MLRYGFRFSRLRLRLHLDAACGNVVIWCYGFDDSGEFVVRDLKLVSNV